MNERSWLGSRVPTWQAGEAGFAQSQGQRYSYHDATEHRVIWFMQEGEEGNSVEFGLVRSLAWMAQNSVEQTGDWIPIDLPEMGVVGDVQVLRVESCPELEEGFGCLVTGWFFHARGEIWEVVLDDGETIETTEEHPFWSVDRNNWIPACDLRRSERLAGKLGSIRVLMVRNTGRIEPVYNIEVEGDHCYRVGQQGLLVHNASTPCCMLFPANHFNGKPGNRIYLSQTTIVGGTWNGQKRSTGAEARLDKENTGKPPGTEADSRIIPPGWDDSLNVKGGIVLIARGHILGAQLGGSGEMAINLIPICQEINQRMRFVETEVKRHVDAGETVDYRVKVEYSQLSDAIPKSIKIEAISMIADGKCWSLQQMPTIIVHPPTLNDCTGKLK